MEWTSTADCPDSERIHGGIRFFQNGAKFKTRYSTLGFSDKAHLDDGQIWPTAYALTTIAHPGSGSIVAAGPGSSQGMGAGSSDTASVAGLVTYLTQRKTTAS